MHLAKAEIFFSKAWKLFGRTFFLLKISILKHTQMLSSALALNLFQVFDYLPHIIFLEIVFEKVALKNLIFYLAILKVDFYFVQ